MFGQRCRSRRLIAHTKEIMDHQYRSRAVIACYVGIGVPKSPDGPAWLTIPRKSLEAAGIGAHCEKNRGFGWAELILSKFLSK